MSIDIIPVPALHDNYIWTLVNRNNKHAVCIDPGDAEPVFALLKREKLILSALLITHHHWDHTNGIKALLNHYPVPVYGPQKEPIASLTQPLLENEQITLKKLDLTLTVLEIPGHTKGHIAFYNQDSVFCGDTLFAAGCGRLFEGTAEQMYQSLMKLSQLPDNTKIYCAHEYTQANLRFAETVEPDNPDIQARLKEVQQLRQKQQITLPSQLAVERLTNPFLRCHTASVRAAAEQFTQQTLASPIAVFAAIRHWKDQF